MSNAEAEREGSVRRLANLLTLQRQARQAVTAAEIEFLLVNDSNLISAYRSAILMRSGHIAALSGVPAPAREAPYTQWAGKLCREIARRYTEATVVAQEDLTSWLQNDWQQHLPEHALWLPMGEQDGLLLARETPWNDADRHLLGHWAEAASQALVVVQNRQRWPRRIVSWLRKRSRIAVGVAALGLVLLGALPVRLSIQAPAEVIPLAPLVVRAPLNGVIDEVAVKPNAAVKSGQLLLRFDEREIRTKLDTVRQGLEAAQAEYRLAQQAAITNREAQANLTILRERIEQRRAEVAQTEALLERTVVVADRDGIVLLPDAETLKGRPVRIGERLLSVADPSAAELELWIAAADALPFRKNSEVEFYLNIAPASPHRALLVDVSYQASLSPGNILGYRAVAAFQEQPPRIGLRGIGKIHGDEVPLAYYLLRRPLTFIREVIGI